MPNSNVRDLMQREVANQLIDLDGRVADLETKEYETVGAAINASANKATPVAADRWGFWDSVDSLLKYLTTTQLLAWLTTLYVGLTGNQTVAGNKTFTGDTHVGDGTGTPNLRIDGAAATSRSLAFRTANVNRWLFQVNGVAESGANAGSDWVLLARADDGSGLSSPLILERATGNIFLGSPSSTLLPSAKLHVYQSTLGSAIFRLENDATNDNPLQIWFQNRITTTGATPTTLHTFPITASRTYIIEVIVIARRTGGASGTADDGALYIRKNAYTTKAGVVTSLGIIISNIEREDVAGWDCALVISGTDVIVQVTGAATTNITWHLVEAKLSSVGS